VLAQILPVACDANLALLVAATAYAVSTVLANVLAVGSFTAGIILASVAAPDDAAVSDALAVADGRAHGATKSCTYNVSDVLTNAVAINVASACPAFRLATCLDGRWSSPSGELWLQAVIVNYFADDLLEF